MLLREVSYARPASVEEAVTLLSEHDGARALAGGQTLVNVMKQRAASPDVLVDLAGLDELRSISVSGTTLEIGAMATLASIIRSSEVEVSRPILAEVAATVADVQVRNRGTLGGNICVNDP
ncbi:FAD binding domain-containing protein, partial [Gaiella sp.]|uniref:FAD binding domain-containing protein n=1 Tax=Gaiella sp. TaxID=2663207 RepID=UPI002B51102D